MTSRETRKRWLIALVGALGSGLAVFFLFSAPGQKKPAVGKIPLASAQVGLSIINKGSLDSILQQETTLRDPTPLFLPTPWNAGESAIPTTERREPLGMFAGYAPKLTFAEPELQLALNSPVAVPQSPSGAFNSDHPAQSYWGFGQLDWIAQPLTNRGAFVEVTAAGDGRRLFTQPLTDARPPTSAPWQPLQFLVAVDPSGVVGPPVLTESSRVAAVDGYFRNYAIQTLRIGERLGPGFYRISIGP